MTPDAWVALIGLTAVPLAFVACLAIARWLDRRGVRR